MPTQGWNGTLGELVETMIRQAGKKLDDVVEALPDQLPTPTSVLVLFKDGTTARIEITKPPAARAQGKGVIR